MPNPTDRPSLKTSLEDLYQPKRVGGDFDAKNITTNGQSPIINSVQSALHTPRGFKTKMMDGSTQMFEAMGNKSLETSKYVKGFSNVKYGDLINAKGK